MALERGFGDMGQELEIIQEELQLKLEMHCVKEQFLGLLENYTTYDDGRHPPHATRYIPAEYAYYNPEQTVVPRQICRCHERPCTNTAGNMHESYLPHTTHNVQRVQNSSSSSDEHQRMMSQRHYAREAVDHRVPLMRDYEPDAMQYQHPQVSPTSVTSSDDYDAKQNGGGHISQGRARVRAFYANRRERLITSRARHGYVAPQSAPTPTPARSTTSCSPASSSSDMDTFVRTAMHHFERTTNTPVLSACSSSDSRERLLETEDLRNNNTPPKCAKDAIIAHSEVEDDESPYHNLLTPIREERSSSSRGSSGLYCSAIEEADEAPALPPRCPLIPTERYREYLSHKSPPDDLGEYVTLKAPDQSMYSFCDEYQSQMEPTLLNPDITTMSNAPFAPAMMSMSFTSDTSGVSHGSGNHREKDSPLREVRYAKSDVISELYTKHDKSLLDISQISSSGVAPGSLTDGTLERHPLSSTMIGSNSPAYRAKLQLSFSDDDSLLARTDDALDSTLEGEAPGSVLSADSRTTTRSEPSAVLRAPNTTQLSLCSPQARDDWYINPQTDLSAHTLATGNTVPQNLVHTVFKTPKNPPRRPRRSDPPRQTPLEPTLCKEHGLHPVYGGSPCIFEDSQDIESDDSDLDFTSVNFSEPSSKLSSKRSSLASKRSSWASKLSSQRSSVARHNSVVDTDCDSSYLSECVDDTTFTHDVSEAENYTAMYDSRRARMRMMRRQTGHTNINDKRHPIGLSESDILDSTQKNLSLHVTRASMPDLHGLSSTSTFEHYSCDELSETTLRESPGKRFFDKSSFKESDADFCDDNNDTIISAASCAQRPLSVCTTTTQATATTDESPESQGGMTVPVNSPNITDSGGSSSRQATTDDYVDVPVNLPKMAKMLESRLQSHAQYPPHVASGLTGYSKHRTRRRYPGSSAGSQQSLGSKQSLHVCSDPIPDPAVYPTRARTARKLYSKKYPHSQDSGFNTQDSRARAMARAAQLQQHYPGHPGQMEFMDNTGVVRSVAKQAVAAKGLDRERKKALSKKLRQFNNNFYGSSSSSLQIKTLGHF